ncbi:hypothetical protein [Photobacterium damselae]|uniref:hypothetical protein n=1 Tax=Photobacterium damselae TaxID=38293 RepID=UPI001F15C96D|nr:hypothetical protein [Photobacterium damselae]UKA12958.1 hypothetical protein IHC91_21475 [Photobacterium damselae subsp. damselae]
MRSNLIIKVAKWALENNQELTNKVIIERLKVSSAVARNFLYCIRRHPLIESRSERIGSQTLKTTIIKIHEKKTDITTRDVALWGLEHGKFFNEIDIIEQFGVSMRDAVVLLRSVIVMQFANVTKSQDGRNKIKVLSIDNVNIKLKNYDEISLKLPQMIKDGWTYEQCGKKFNTSVTSISRIAKKQGISTRKYKKRLKEERKAISDEKRENLLAFVLGRKKL